MPANKPFTTELTDAVMEAACESARMNPAGASLLRFGENAIYGLATLPVVVRVGRLLAAAEKESQVARWLQGHKFPAARLALDFDEPMVIDGLPVTFWQKIDEIFEPITPSEFGTILHDLHRLPPPTDFELPKFSPMPKVENRLREIPDGYLTQYDIKFLHEKFEELAAKYEELTFILPRGPVHGDAHVGNLMRDQNGQIKLIDFEDFAFGPREWDAAVLSVRHQAFGWVTEDDYQRYVTAYGFDPIAWDGFPVIRAIRELNMTTWLAQTIGESSGVVTEVRKRISDLRDDQAPRNWRAY